MTNAEDLYTKLKEIRYEATAIQAKVSDAFRMLNELEIVDKPRPTCERCRASFAGPLSFAEHLYISHDGPVPSHWEDAEERSAA